MKFYCIARYRDDHGFTVVSRTCADQSELDTFIDTYVALGYANVYSLHVSYYKPIR